MSKSISTFHKGRASSKLVGLLMAISFALPMTSNAENAVGVTVGAVRWDAWVGDTDTSSIGVSNVGLQVEATLGPNQFHDRLPFYAVETSANSVYVRQLTQPLMDTDIAYANRAGINYWAFNYYPMGSGVDTARNLYFASNVKNGLKYTYIIDKSFMPATNFPLITSEFSRNYFQRVLDQRPLLYIYGKDNDGNPYTASEITALRNMSIGQGQRNPYIVVMHNSAASAASLASSIGADAISSYVSGLGGGGPYSGIANKDATGWSAWQSTGMSVVPWVTTGWDNRPRSINPVVWIPPANPNDWTQAPSPAEIGANLQNAINWVGGNQASTNANTVMMYAWNEFDEGGWLTPTLYYGADRVNAVSNTLKYSSSSNWDSNQTASQAFDQNPSTNWQAASGTSFAGQWLEIDFGADSVFNQANISEFGNRTGAFNIQYLTGSRWNTVYYGNTIGSNATINFPTVAGRKVRLNFTSGLSTPVIYEFKLNYSPDSNTNAARNKSYAGSSQWDGNQTPDKAFDGNNSTNWQAANGSGFAGQWLEVDFGVRKSINTAAISEYGNRTGGYRIEYWNGSSWTTAHTGTAIGINSTVTFPAVNTSKARIYFTSGTDTPIIYELGFYAN